MNVTLLVGDGRLGLGIDTGGMYTDAGVVEMGSKKVLAKAKSPPTYHDPSIGLEAAVDGVVSAGGFEPGDVGIVGLSTTRATWIMGSPAWRRRAQRHMFGRGSTRPGDRTSPSS